MGQKYSLCQKSFGGYKFFFCFSNRLSHLAYSPNILKILLFFLIFWSSFWSENSVLYSNVICRFFDALILLGMEMALTILKSRYEFELTKNIFRKRILLRIFFCKLENVVFLTIFKIFRRNQLFVKLKISCFFYFNSQQLSQFLEFFYFG